MTAIALAHHLKGKGFALSTIAREIALDIAASEYEPDAVEHLPGVMNFVPDVLSRRFEPGKVFSLPAVLTSAKEVQPPARTMSWWRSYQVKRGAPLGEPGREGGGAAPPVLISVFVVPACPTSVATQLLQAGD